MLFRAAALKNAAKNFHSNNNTVSQVEVDLFIQAFQGFLEKSKSFPTMSIYLKLLCFPRSRFVLLRPSPSNFSA